MDVTEGNCFILDGNNGTHLWAVISDPQQSNDEIVIANFTTLKNKSYEDTSCIIETGEHKFFKDKQHRSYVFYNRSRVVNLSELELWLRTGQLKPYPEPLSSELLEKVRAGAKETIHLPFGVERVLSMQELI